MGGDAGLKPGLQGWVGCMISRTVGVRGACEHAPYGWLGASEAPGQARGEKAGLQPGITGGAGLYPGLWGLGLAGCVI